MDKKQITQKIIQTIQTTCVFIYFFLLTVLFWMIIPIISVVPQILATLLLYTLIIVVPIILYKLNKIPISKLGFSKKNIGMQFLVTICMLVVLVGWFIVLPLMYGRKASDVLGVKPTLTQLLLRLPFFVLFVGLGEELLFRGYFLDRIKTITSSNVCAIIISSLMFGLFHYPSNHSIGQVVVTTIIGAFFAIVRVKFKNATILSLALAHGYCEFMFLFTAYLIF